VNSKSYSLWTSILLLTGLTAAGFSTAYPSWTNICLLVAVIAATAGAALYVSHHATCAPARPSSAHDNDERDYVMAQLLASDQKLDSIAEPLAINNKWLIDTITSHSVPPALIAQEGEPLRAIKDLVRTEGIFKDSDSFVIVGWSSQQLRKKTKREWRGVSRELGFRENDDDDRIKALPLSERASPSRRLH